jgi:membrane fusion protein, heavy metal efflux system
MTRRTVRGIWAAVAIASAIAAGCRKAPEAAPPEVPSLDVTSWTDTTELFMEYPPLVAAQTARFAVHLTRLADFSALTTGRPHIEMTPEAGGAPVTLPGSDALRPGAFRVEGRLPAAGRYRWALVVDAPGVTDRHDLGIATVFAEQSAAVADAEKQPEGDPAAISYLKEQQWTNEFATSLVRDGEVRASIRVPAVIQPLTGGEAIVGAPAAGRFAAETLISIGDTVRQGQSLGRLEPRLAASDDRATLVAALAEAEAAVAAAHAERDRAERLVVEKAVPARRVDDARRAVAVAEARYRAAEARVNQRDQTLRSGGGDASGNAFNLRAPIAGRVADVMATLGASYEEGAPLFKIVRTDEVELQTLIPVADVDATRQVDSVAFETPGAAEPVLLRPHHRHDPGVIDAQTRALSVQFSVDNPSGRLLIGQSGTAVLFTKNTVRVPVVPRAAVLMEAGRPYVFVQAGGETFARRFVELAARDGDIVGIRSGVKPGERVVIRGAYEVQLASAARGLPAEGHVH